MQRRFVLASLTILLVACTSVVASIWLATRTNPPLVPARVLFLLSGVLSLTAAVLGVSACTTPVWRSSGTWLFFASSALFALFLHAWLARTMPL